MYISPVVFGRRRFLGIIHHLHPACTNLAAARGLPMNAEPIHISLLNAIYPSNPGRYIAPCTLNKEVLPLSKTVTGKRDSQCLKERVLLSFCGS